MTHVSEVIDSIRKRIQLDFVRREARRCARLYEYYQERPNVFTREEWHDSLLRWNQYVAEYEHGQPTT